jgi:hypothetical protein
MHEFANGPSLPTCALHNRVSQMRHSKNLSEGGVPIGVIGTPGVREFIALNSEW